MRLSHGQDFLIGTTPTPNLTYQIRRKTDPYINNLTIEYGKTYVLANINNSVKTLDRPIVRRCDIALPSSPKPPMQSTDGMSKHRLTLYKPTIIHDSC